MNKKQIKVQLTGLDCSSCVMHIDGVLEDIRGVFRAKTSFAASQVEIAYDPAQVSAKDLLHVMEQAGYKDTKVLQ